MKVETHPDTTVFMLPGKKNLVVTILAPFLIALLAYILNFGITLFVSYIPQMTIAKLVTKPAGIILFLLIFGFNFLPALFLTFFLFYYFGREIITVDSRFITDEIKVFGVGFRRQYERAEISNLRLENIALNEKTGERKTFKFLGKKGTHNFPSFSVHDLIAGYRNIEATHGQLVFQYKGKRKRLAVGITKEEADRILGVIDPSAVKVETAGESVEREALTLTDIPLSDNCGRVKAYADGKDIRIEISPYYFLQLAYIGGFFILFFLGKWYEGGIEGISALIRSIVELICFPGSSDSFGIFFMLFWSAGWIGVGGGILLAIFWYLAGHHEIKLSSQTLELGRKIFGKGWLRTYQLDKVSNLRVDEPAESKYAKRVVFDHGAAAVVIIKDLDADEAEFLSSILRLNRAQRYSFRMKLSEKVPNHTLRFARGYVAVVLLFFVPLFNINQQDSAIDIAIPTLKAFAWPYFIFADYGGPVGLIDQSVNTLTGIKPDKCDCSEEKEEGFYLENDKAPPVLAYAYNLEETLHLPEIEERHRGATAGVLHGVGLKSYNEKNYPAALSYWLEELKQTPNSANNHNNVGMTLLELGYAHNAFDYHRKALELDPQFAHGHYRLGRDYLRIKDFAAAKAEFIIALKKGYRSLDTRYNLALSYKGLNEVESALKEFQEVVKIDPETVSVYYHMGRCYEMQSKNMLAKMAYKKEIRLNSKWKKLAEDAFNNVGGKGTKAQLSDSP